jgi:hypothetical protein
MNQRAVFVSALVMGLAPVVSFLALMALVAWLPGLLGVKSGRVGGGRRCYVYFILLGAHLSCDLRYSAHKQLLFSAQVNHIIIVHLIAW